jgi:hypothetical protein
MNGVIKKLADAGHLSDEQIKAIESRVADFVKAAEKDPKLMVEAQEKLGGIWDKLTDPAKRFGKGLSQQLPTAAVNMAALSIIGGAAGATGEVYRSLKESANKARAYKTMMEEAGERLEGIPARQIQQSFNTLHAANPSYAEDPVVAAEFVRETSRSEAYPFQLLKTVTDPDRKRPRDLRMMSPIMSPMKATDKLE